MKTKLFFLLVPFLLLPVLSGCMTIPEDDEYYNDQSYAAQTNYDEYNANDLNAYGQWMNTPEYGRVWHPNTSSDWQPFVDGHWVYDGQNWVWVSYEPYGNIVYHYGNWEYYGTNGWVWIPNRAQWSPACVQWVYYGDVVAWAPRPLRKNAWGNPWDHQAHPAWVGVNTRDFNADHVATGRMRVIDRDENRYSNDQIVRKQPDVKYIQTRVRGPIPVVKDPVKLGRVPDKNDHTIFPNRIDDKPQSPAPANGIPTNRPIDVNNNNNKTNQPGVTNPGSQNGGRIPVQNGRDIQPKNDKPVVTPGVVPGTVNNPPQVNYPAKPATPVTPPVVKGRNGRGTKRSSVASDQTGGTTNKPVRPSRSVDRAKQRIDNAKPAPVQKTAPAQKPVDKRTQPPAARDNEKRKEETR
jgi:hypothetical protein